MNAALRAFRPMLAPTLLLIACVAGGGALVWMAKRSIASDLRALATAKNERKAAEQRVARLAEEARSIPGYLAIWDRLTGLRIVGVERRLEWLDALARIGAARGLHDLRYQIEAQKSSKSELADAALQVRSSTMKVEMSLLHEGELLRFLEDLRNSGNAYYAIRRCSIHRLAGIPGPAAAAALRGKCEIDLITLAEAKGST